MQHINFIIKSTHACNAECIYCSADAHVSRRTTLQINVIERLFKRLRECYLENGYPRKVRLTWHGGEPLMRSNSFYYRVMELQAGILSDLKMSVNHTMQTNLLPLNKEKAAMLRELLKRPDGSFSQVGTSMDPVPGIRRLKGNDYQQCWLKKKDLLLTAGLRYGVICVVHKRHLNRVGELFDYFAEFYYRDGATTRFNPLYHSGRAKQLNGDIHLTPRDWAQFMIDFHKIWSQADRQIPFRPFQEYDQFHAGSGSLRSCELSGKCMNNHLGLDSDGSVYQCGRAVDENAIRLGHLKTGSLAEIAGHSMRNRLRNRVVYLKNGLCRACQWWEYCHGGCPNETLAYTGTLAAKSHWCAARRLFLKSVYGTPRSIGKAANHAHCNSASKSAHEHHVVDTEFKDYERYGGRFTVTGSDYSKLIARSEQFAGRIATLVYAGPLKAVDRLPDCHLNICLDVVTTQELAEMIDRLIPECISFSIGDPGDVLPKVTDLAQFPFELDMTLILECLDRKALMKIIGQYLHAPANRLKIQPLHAILEAFIQKKRISLWDILWANPESWCHITGSDVVMPSGNDGYKRIWQFRKHQLVMTEDGQQLVHKQMHAFAQDERCQPCAYYFICGGCIRAIYHRCDNWIYTLGKLQQAARQLLTASKNNNGSAN